MKAMGMSDTPKSARSRGLVRNERQPPEELRSAMEDSLPVEVLRPRPHE